MPPKLARAIAELAHGEPYTITHLRDRFPAGTKDIEWIGTLSQEGGWQFISEDRRIRQRPHELEALKRSSLIGFFLAKGWNQAGLWERAALLIGWWRLLWMPRASRPPVKSSKFPTGNPAAP